MREISERYSSQRVEDTIAKMAEKAEYCECSALLEELVVAKLIDEQIAEHVVPEPFKVSSSLLLPDVCKQRHVRKFFE